MQEFNKIQSMAKTEVQKENMASDQMKNYVEKQLNTGNETVLEDVNNISRNKDSIGGVEFKLDNKISKPDHDIKQKIDDTEEELDKARHKAPKSIGEKGLNSLREIVKNGQISAKDFVDKNVPDAINSTYSADGTKTNDRTSEVTSLTGYTGPEAMNKNKPPVDGQLPPGEIENIIKSLGNNNPKTSNNQQNQIEMPKK